MADKISFEEHKKFGDLCKKFNEKLVSEEVKIKSSAKNKEERRKKANRHEKSIKALSELKDNLDEIMFKDFPNKATTDIYYGKQND